MRHASIVRARTHAGAVVAALICLTAPACTAEQATASEETVLEATFEPGIGLALADTSAGRLGELLTPADTVMVVIGAGSVPFASVDWQHALTASTGPFLLEAYDGTETRPLAQMRVTVLEQSVLDSVEAAPHAESDASEELATGATEDESTYACLTNHYYYRCNNCICSWRSCTPYCITYRGGWMQRYLCLYGTLYRVSGGYCSSGCLGTRSCSVI